ncbi:MAG TPA: clostripain-related cysteine peptidase [Candidatus Cloacimonadota bacterium]|nr:clostripain-related cysteine peptidase [Candidatus Cloacimonadota bacterium]HQB40694.1 clostripain-related cysteine peptidase [Candidatus Cloacimonadota bacterium]
MKKLFLLLLGITLFSIIQAKEWLFFVYMAADNGLYQYAIDDINKLEAGIQDNMEIIVFIDHLTGSDKEGAEVLRIVKDTSSRVVSPRIKYYGDVNSGDYRVLNQFMKWGQSHYSGKNEVMIVWSHGTGWFRGETKHVCPDNDYSSAISVSNGELKKAFHGLKRKFDLLFFDACLMGNMETMVEIKESCNYYMASITEMPAFGLPWVEILNEWNNYTEKIDKYNSIITHYIESYEFGGSHNPHGDYYYSLALFLAQISVLEPVLDQLNYFSNTFASEASLPVFSDARNNCLPFNDMQADVEIKQFFELLKESSQYGSDLWNTSDNMLNLLDMLFIKSGSSNLIVNGYASVWYPIYEDAFYEIYTFLYHNLGINQTQFSRFLNYTFGEDTRPPHPIQVLDVSQALNSLYLQWEAPIDPCPLQYQVEVYADGQRVLTDIIVNTSFTYTFDHEVQNGKIAICAIDEAGNKSAFSNANYNKKTEQKRIAYISPNPVYDLNTAKVHWLSDHNTSKMEIKLYTISGDLVGTKTLMNLSQGEHSLSLNELIKGDKKLSTGLYTLVLKGGDFMMKIQLAIIC